MQRAAAAPAAVAAAVPVAAVAGVAAGALPGGLPMAPPVYVSPPADIEADDGGDDGNPQQEGGGSLASVAKAASMKAERAAIEQTLRQVHWNRRKAAQILGVSYKTLLNKIKECGISRA
jgi:DNA-binding NtrC family response regulator